LKIELLKKHSFPVKTIILSSIFLSGCAWNVDRSPQIVRSSASDFSLGEALHSGQQRFDGPLLCPSDVSAGFGKPCKNALERMFWTREKLEHIWGPPASIEKVGDDACLIYHHKLTWRGDIIGPAMIPIPLVLPAFDIA